MANTNSALALALGAGGGLALWYLLRDNTKNPAPGSAAPVAPAAPAAPPAPTAPARQAAPAESSPVQMACTVRLDAAGLTVDGARVGIADAVQRCKLAGLAAVTVSKDASAAAYADLMIALGRAGIPAFANRNGAPRNARPRAVDDINLAAFARTVRSLAEHVEPDPNPDGRARGRFGERKVFIAAIRRALRSTNYARLSRAAVDELLLRAHREQLLDLARADLVAAMDPDEVRDSEVTHPTGAHFHFVIVERNADTYRTFTLALYTQGDHVSPRMRWFTADPPTTWVDARDRLAAAGILDPNLVNRTRSPGGWIMTVHPVMFREQRAEPLPGGGSDDE